MILTDYPDTIANVELQILRLQRESDATQILLERRRNAIERIVLVDPDLKNEAQRKAELQYRLDSDIIAGNEPSYQDLFSLKQEQEYKLRELKIERDRLVAEQVNLRVLINAEVAKLNSKPNINN